MLKPKPPAPELREQRSPLWWFRWLPAVVVTVLLLDLLYVVGRLALVPVLASLALAYLVNPIVYQIEKRGLSRPVAALAALLIVTLVAAGFLVFITPAAPGSGGSWHRDPGRIPEHYSCCQSLPD